MRVVFIAMAVAVLLVLGYALLISPAFEPHWDDQVAYLRLASGLAQGHGFTRADPGAPFAPEPLWPPGYPLFLAPLCLAGCSHWIVAIAQALLYAALVLLSYGLARATVGRRAAQAVAVLVALYLPLAYWAAIAYSDFLAAFLLTAGIVLFIRARSTGSTRWAFACGAVIGWLALTRVVYLLFPGALVLLAFLVDGRRLFTRERLLPLAVVLAAFALVVAPLFAYSERYFGQPFLSSSGASLWLGVGQGLGRHELDRFETQEVAEADAQIAAFDRITDRVEQAHAWVALNASLGAHALRWIAHDPVGYVARIPLRLFVLWAGDTPVTVDASRSLGAEARVAIGAAELVLLAFGLAGAIMLARRRRDATLAPLVVILYVSVTLAPLWTQPRYSLGAKPLVLIAAVAGLTMLLRRRREDYSPTNF